MEDGTAAVATPAPSAGAATTIPAPAAPTPSASPVGRQSDDDLIDASVAQWEAEREAKSAEKLAAKEARAAKKAEAEAEDGEETRTAPAEPESTEPEAKAEPEEAQDEKAEAKGEDEVEELIRDAEIPKSWKETIRELKGINPKVAREIRDEHFELAAYREQMPLEQAREIRQLFQSADEAQDARLAMGDVQALKHSLNTDPGKFLSFIRDIEPESFPNVVNTFPKWLWSEHPDIFVETLGKPITHHSLANVQKYGERTGNSLFVDAAQVVLEALDEIAKDGGPKDQDDPRFRELEELRREKDENQRATQRTESQRFVTTVRDESARQVKADITRTIDRLIPGIKDKARQEIHNRALYGVVSQVMSDKQFTAWVTREGREGQRDGEHQKRVIGAVLGRSKPLVSQSVANAIRWYQDVFGSPGALRESREREAPEREIGQGAPAGTGRRGKSWSQMTAAEKKAMSADEIIERSARGELTA